MIYRIVISFACLTALIIGCTPNTEPTERTANSAMDKVVQPLVQKGISELSTRTGQLQGQMTGVNPGYHLSGFGLFGTGIVYDMRLNLDGVSGNLAGAGQLDQGEPLPDSRPAIAHRRLSRRSRPPSFV